MTTLHTRPAPSASPTPESEHPPDPRRLASLCRRVVRSLRSRNASSYTGVLTYSDSSHIHYEAVTRSNSFIA